MRTLHIMTSTSFQPKMAKRGLVTILEEITVNTVKAIIKAREYQIKFAGNSIDKLIKILNIPIEGDKIDKSSIESEEIENGDIVLLAAPTQSCVFRYFIITFYKNKRFRRNI